MSAPESPHYDPAWADDVDVDDILGNPEPYRSPLGWNCPTVIGPNRPVEVQVSFPNEDPDTEDDLTLNFVFTDEGIVIDLFVSEDQPVASFCQTYEEFVGTLHDLDPAMRRMAEKVNADVLDSMVEAIVHDSSPARIREVLSAALGITR